MNIARKYTDEVYATRKQVADEIGIHCLEPVWKQILAYRNEHMMKCGDVEFCLCPGILKKMIRFDQMLHRMKTLCPDIQKLITSEQGEWMFQTFCKTEGSFVKRLHDLCRFYECPDEQSILYAKNNSEFVFPFVVWCMMKYGQSEFSVLLVSAAASEANMPHLLNLLNLNEELPIVYHDATYALDQCLSQWSIKAQKLMMKENEAESDLKDLKYQYPQLKHYQIQFYLDHHVPGYFYTIEQFIEFSDVCYETGRTSLQQLVNLGFYQKIKQGKKFVYTAR